MLRHGIIGKLARFGAKNSDGVWKIDGSSTRTIVMDAIWNVWIFFWGGVMARKWCTLCVLAVDGYQAKCGSPVCVLGQKRVGSTPTNV